MHPTKTHRTPSSFRSLCPSDLQRVRGGDELVIAQSGVPLSGTGKTIPAALLGNTLGR